MAVKKNTEVENVEVTETVEKRGGKTCWIFF